MHYVMGSNAVLDRLVEPAMRTARRLSKKSGETEHVYGQFRYKTKKTWSTNGASSIRRKSLAIRTAIRKIIRAS